MKKMLAILLILISLFEKETKAQLVNTEAYKLKIQEGTILKKGSRTFYVIPITFTNLSQDSLKYFSLGCSWQEIYLVDNDKLFKMGNICEKDYPVISVLAPNKSKTVQLEFLVDEAIDSARLSFRIGLNFKPANKPRHEFNIREFLNKDHVIWSNIITM